MITRPGGSDVLAVQEVPTPEPVAGEVRVRVIAAGVNRADLLQRAGLYPPPAGVPPDIPGLEFAGVVDALGPGVKAFQPGQRVFGLAGGGAQAEYLCIEAGMLAEIPPNLDFVQAAAVPEAFVTAFDALFNQARLLPGERVLVHAAGSGVGTAAVQLVRAAGAEAFGTSRSAEKLERARSLGLATGFPAAGFAAAVVDKTGGRGVDVILDFIGGAYLAENLKALAPLGRLVCIGLLSGRAGEIDLGLVLSKRLRLFGTVLRGRPLAEKLSVAGQFAAHVVPLLRRGDLRPVVDRVEPIERVRFAHDALQENAIFGKVVLQISPEV